MYWQDRLLKSQELITNRGIKKTEAQLKKYYRNCMERTIQDFTDTYNKIMLRVEDGHQPSPADLYKLDKYWQAQAQLKRELNLLGDKQIALLSKQFETNFFDIYYSWSLPGSKSFQSVEPSLVRQMINQVWCSDGKTWSQRVWTNTERLAQTLNDELIHCVATGKKTTELKQVLQQRFNVSYSQADTLVRTEMAHIQTQASVQRYKDSGLEFYEIKGNENDTCGQKEPDCHKLDGEKFRYTEMVVGVNCPPFHPNCRCCILPVID